MTGSRSAGADPKAFVSLIVPAVRRAALLARSLEGQAVNDPKMDEATDVKQALTEADTAAQEILLTALCAHFPDVCLAAEEDTPTVSCFSSHADSQVIIDPVDGTLHSYLEASGPYAVIVGLTTANRYEAGIVALPREGILCAASRGAGALVGMPGRPMREVSACGDGDRVLVAHNTPPEVSSWLRERGMVVIPACGGAVSIAPLLPGVRAGLRWAGGELGISIRGRAGVLIAREGRAVVCGAANAAFPQDSTSPANVLLVGAGDEDIALLDAALAEHPPPATA